MEDGAEKDIGRQIYIQSVEYKLENEDRVSTCLYIS